MTDFMNEYCMHTATCGELRKGDVGREVVLCGWAWHNRDHGGLIFVDLRDRAGYTQVVVDPDCVSADDFAKAEHLGREYVLKIAGTVRERGAEAANPNMATGEIEVLAKSVEVLNTSVTPPFSIEDGIETDETTRMKWRYLDIRRPEMYQALHLRHKVAQAMRGALNERGFLEVETPILANSTPEGARDYIVPSRPNPGRFYALPQSPQQFKQMLMVGGIERYYQIARCFRDEDLRADRQPEFTQVDIEMGFVQGEDVMNLMEDVMAETLAAVGVEHAFPLERMQYRESMDRFGNDRPDTRFGMELVDITDIVKNTGFKVFSSVAQSGGVVKAINAKGAGDWSRGDVEKLADVAAENGAKGMAWIAFHDRRQGEEPHHQILQRRGVRRAEGGHGRGAGRPSAVRRRHLRGGERRAERAAPAYGRRAGRAARGPSAAVGGELPHVQVRRGREEVRRRAPSVHPRAGPRTWTRSRATRWRAAATATTWSWTASRPAAAPSVSTTPTMQRVRAASTCGFDRRARPRRSSATSSTRSSLVRPAAWAASRWASDRCVHAAGRLRRPSATSWRSRRRASGSDLMSGAPSAVTRRPAQGRQPAPDVGKRAKERIEGPVDLNGPLFYPNALSSAPDYAAGSPVWALSSKGLRCRFRRSNLFLSVSAMPWPGS